MAARAEGRTVAVLAADGFEEAELFSPKEAVEREGGRVVVVSHKSGEIEANRHRQHGRSLPVDQSLKGADPAEFDAVIVPGGLFSPDSLRQQPEAAAFVRALFESGKPVAAICHGPQVLIEAGIVKGRRMTSVGAIRTDLKNAGADVVDEPAVTDGALVTSRTPEDLDSFNEALLEAIAAGERPRAAAE